MFLLTCNSQDLCAPGSYGCPRFSSPGVSINTNFGFLVLQSLNILFNFSLFMGCRLAVDVDLCLLGALDAEEIAADGESKISNINLFSLLC